MTSPELSSRDRDAELPPPLALEISDGRAVLGGRAFDLGITAIGALLSILIGLAVLLLKDLADTMMEANALAERAEDFQKKLNAGRIDREEARLLGRDIVAFANDRQVRLLVPSASVDLLVEIGTNLQKL